MARNFNLRRDRVRVPVQAINQVNAGGYTFSSMIECYGASKSGKSTFCYQTAEYLLQDYGDDALVLVLDAENAVNVDRCQLAFGLNFDTDPRILRRPAMTLEGALENFMKVLKRVKEENKCLLVIWDSISASGSSKADEGFQEAIEADKMATRGATEPMSRAQVMKWALNRILGEIYDLPVIVFLINQLTTKVNQFNTSIDSSGGYALRHNVNERLRFDFVKNVGGDKKGDMFKTGTMSKVTVAKSRSIPSLQDVQILIDDTMGGRIIPEHEVPLFASALGILKMKSGGWYSIAEEYMSEDMPEAARKSMQYKDIASNDEYVKALSAAITIYFRKTFKLVDYIYTNMEQNAEVSTAASEKKKKVKESVDADGVISTS